jgi:hypothetical protein
MGSFNIDAMSKQDSSNFEALRVSERDGTMVRKKKEKINNVLGDIAQATNFIDENIKDP